MQRRPFKETRPEDEKINLLNGFCCFRKLEAQLIVELLLCLFSAQYLSSANRVSSKCSSNAYQVPVFVQCPSNAYPNALDVLQTRRASNLEVGQLAEFDFQTLSLKL